LKKKYRIDWTEALTTRLMMYWEDCNGNYKLVAEKMGLPPNRVKDKAKSIGLRKHKQKKLIVCLTCRKDFFSDGDHNRICSDCKKSDLFQGNVA